MDTLEKRQKRTLSVKWFKMFQLLTIAKLTNHHFVCKSGLKCCNSCFHCYNYLFVCLHCQSLAHTIDGRPVTHVDVEGTMLDVEATFCYLGDMHDTGGSCNTASASRCCVAWGKFRKQLHYLSQGAWEDLLGLCLFCHALRQ